MHPIRRLLLVAISLTLALSAGVLPGSAATSVKPYAVPLVQGATVRPLWSVGDDIARSDGPGSYQMVGIPDGLGAAANPDGTATLYMNHEFTQPTLSEPVVGGLLNRGAIVSKVTLDADGDPLAGERAYDWAYQGDSLIGPAPTQANDTPAFGRFCSASLAGPAEGLDRQMYFTNEEADGAATFDGMGGQTAVVFDNEVHALPGMGHFSKENTLVMPGTGRRTVIMSLEDGPSSPDSQLYVYVGTKRLSGTVLQRNGLVGGTLYTFVSTTSGRINESTFRRGTLTGKWVPIPGAGGMTDVELEASADALGAFGFVRIEDGAFSKTGAGDFFFVTTGGNASAGNELGRLYQMRLDPANPTGPSSLRIVYNADHVIAAGGDIAISPDNLDTSSTDLLIQEDGTTQSRAVMAEKSRDGSIWRFPLMPSEAGQQVNVAGRTRVVELDPPGRDGIAVGPGVWETSGIIDTSAIFGPGTWLFDVQAHGPTTAPEPYTVEDGQLLLLSL